MGSANDPMAGLLSGLDGLSAHFSGPKSMKEMRSPAGQQRSTVPAATSSRMGAATPGQTDQRWGASQVPFSGRASSSADPFTDIQLNPASTHPSTSPVRWFVNSGGPPTFAGPGMLNCTLVRTQFAHACSKNYA